jgi:hypothetical protein
MSTQSYRTRVARSLEDIVSIELSKRIKHCFALNLVDKHLRDEGRPQPCEVFAAYIFEHERANIR